jgi:hypothetical protein
MATEFEPNKSLKEKVSHRLSLSLDFQSHDSRSTRTNCLPRLKFYLHMSGNIMADAIICSLRNWPGYHQTLHNPVSQNEPM